MWPWIPFWLPHDFIAPLERGVRDYIGAFCVTTGHGVEKIASRFEKENDDYNSIMIKALADRLAEAFAEYLHREIRTRYWGYAPEESLSNEELAPSRISIPWSNPIRGAYPIGSG